MIKPQQVRRYFHSTIARYSLLLVGLLLPLGASGCGGGNRFSGDHAGRENGPFLITPASATVIAGQTQAFVVNSPWGHDATWSVLPATAGSTSPTGIFTASSTPGPCEIVAMWNSDVRYTATASVVVVVAPAPAQISPNLVQAFGASQATGNGATRNTSVVGETVPARTAATMSGAEQVRHGFDPQTSH